MNWQEVWTLLIEIEVYELWRYVRLTYVTMVVTDWPQAPDCLECLVTVSSLWGHPRVNDNPISEGRGRGRAGVPIHQWLIFISKAHLLKKINPWSSCDLTFKSYFQELLFELSSRELVDRKDQYTNNVNRINLMKLGGVCSFSAFLYPIDPYSHIF